MIRTPFASYAMNAILRAPEADAGAGAGGADKGAGAGAGGAAVGAAAGAGDKPWYEAGDYGFDNDTLSFYKGKNYPDIKTALSSLPIADNLARNRNVMPKPDPAKLNDWEGWKELGWTPDVKDYTVKKPALKEGQVLDEAMFSSFVQDAHGLRIPLPAAQALFEKQFGKAYERIAQMDAAGAGAKAELETKLKAELGDQYDAKVDLSKRAWRAFGIGMDDSAELEKIVGSPGLVKIGIKLAEKLGEDKLVDGGSSASQTPQSARAQRLALEGDPEWMKVFNDARNPRNKDYVAQRQALIDIEAGKK